MGHGSDKLYITHSEHTGEFGQHSASSSGALGRSHTFARLPFDCCALTLKPFDTPVCTADGTTYDLLSIIPFIRQHGTDPVTGEKLTPGDLIRLHFSRNAEGVYHDPVTFKTFNEHTHLVAIRTSGNVYARESIDRLNIKPGNWHDLVTDEAFTRKDIITLQDPQNVEGRDLTKFDYVKRDLKINPDGELSGINSGTASAGVSRVLKSVAESTQIKSSTTTATKDQTLKAKPVVTTSLSANVTPYNASVVSAGRTGASLTSTAAPISTKTENALWDEEDLMFEAVQAKGEKGYARLVTNYGNLNLELYCDRAPRTCYNFLQLARQNKYKDTVFHRLIPGFMIQGGGLDGTSIWGKAFQDEYPLRNAYKHADRGTLSMANSGPNTNGCQFFLTFRATPHLDGKHTVFGRLVGGDDVLNKLERVPTDASDRPLKPVILKDVAVFGDPYETYKKRLEKRLTREAEARSIAAQKVIDKEARGKDRTTWFGTTLATHNKDNLNAAPTSTGKNAGVGKYLNSHSKRPLNDAALETQQESTKKRKSAGFGEFAGW